MSSHENPWIFWPIFTQIPQAPRRGYRLSWRQASLLLTMAAKRADAACFHSAMTRCQRTPGASGTRRFFFLKKWGKSMGNPGFGVLKWFGSPSHRFSELKWSSMTWMISGYLHDLGNLLLGYQNLGNGLGNLDFWYLDLRLSMIIGIFSMGNTLRLGNWLRDVFFFRHVQVGETYLSVSGEHWGNKLQASLAKAFLCSTANGVLLADQLKQPLFFCRNGM